MAIVNGYLTYDEARSYVGQNASVDQAELEDAVTAASRLIDRVCGRHFYKTDSVARLFDSVDGRSVEFGLYNDCVELDAVDVDSDGDGVFDISVSPVDVQLLPAQVGDPVIPYTMMVRLDDGFPVPPPGGRRGLVKVTGVWGWPEVPVEVKQATRILVAEVAKLRDAPLGVAGFGDFGVMRVGRQLPARVVDLLTHFRHPLHFGFA